jgi:hypothetical protein
MVYGKRAASSLYALAETLRRRHAGMGTANPADAAHEADPNEEDDAERDLARVISETSRAAREEKNAIAEMLQRLDAVVADPDANVSKWPAMVADCLDPNAIRPDGKRQLVVFTEFADTADWLVARFRRDGYTAKRYSGRDSHAVRDDIRAEFASREFQVIVSTDAGNEGIDLQSAHVLVNWDIPWSLVRLEQRMGRIHRVGQQDKVWLYNMIATDTREGAAHRRLLDNLIAAANELGGKMFDSLSLVGELALAEAGIESLEKLLQQTYERSGDERAIESLQPSLYQGGLLADPTNVTDYELHVYAVQVTEGGGRRSSAWSYLVRVDATGARVVAWEILANLEADRGTAGTPHPAAVTNAEHAARLAFADDQRTRAASLAEWSTSARNQLRRLPNDLSDDIADGVQRRELRGRLTDAVNRRMQELEAAMAITAGELARVGWARVRVTGMPGAPVEKDSETIATAHVVSLLNDQGYTVADVHSEGRGYDLHARKGREQRCVEVKGVWESASSRGITVTGNELAKAGLLGRDYWLYVVDHCQTGGTLYAGFEDPAAVFHGAMRDVAVLRIPGSELRAARERAVA